MNILPKSALICSTLCFLLWGTSASGQGVPPMPHSVVVIAHRGNHVNVPENTLAACREAIRVGVDYVEIDLRTTKDGKMVLLHDAKVDRTTDGQGALSELTWKQVKKLQVKSKDGQEYRIPTFEEVLKLCRGKVNIYLDFKNADVPKTWALIRRTHMEKQVVVYLNKEEQYHAWKATAPNLPLMTSLPDQYRVDKGLENFLKKMDVQILDNLQTPELVQEAKNLGVAVWLDVQSPLEGPARWEATLQKGVAGLQTDHPEALIEYLKLHKIR